MTIDELLAASGLTANDEIPIWDAESTGEPTKKITAQNFADSVATLANLRLVPTVVNVTANQAYTQSVSGTGLHVVRYGNVVTVNGNIKLSNTFPDTGNDAWAWWTVYSGLPNVGFTDYCHGILRFDTAPGTPAMVLINGTNLQVSARGASIRGLQGLLFATYICTN